MEYQIVGISAHGRPSIPISKTEYEILRKARSGLNTILAFEETFDALMGNYADLESAILETALSAMLFREHEEALDIYIARSLVARRVLNFLSSARLYRDSYPAHVARIFGRRSDVTRRLTASLSDLKTSSRAYRFIDALRNNSQHSELPVHGISFNFARAEEDSSSTSVIPKIIPKVLRADRQFPVEILKEMSADDKEFALLPPLREYLEHITKLHHETRDVLVVKDNEWRQQYQTAIDAFKKAHPSIKTILIRAQPKRPEHDDDLIYMPLGKYRDYLARKHRKIANLSKHFVSWK